MKDPRNTPIVITEKLRKSYRQGKVSVPALRGVSLIIEQGEFIALVGPSGSGKTTLLNLIGGLDRPDSGTVGIDGRQITELSSTEIARIRLHRVGFVFQSYNLIPVLSAIENVEYVMLLQGLPKDARRLKAAAALDELGLSDKHDRRPAELSGGEQQRVAVARAIVADPAIILADEPTANLDSKTARDLIGRMRIMNEKTGVTVIFATHDEMVMESARRVVHLRDGQVSEDERRV